MILCKIWINIYNKEVIFELMPPFIDLTNKKYNRLLVLDIYTKKNNKTYWRCKCDCGQEVIVEGYQLTSGRTKSCGCLNRELASKHIKDYNNNRKNKRYIKFDTDLNCIKVFIGDDNKYFLCDECDIDIVEKYNWYIDNLGYVIATVYIDNKPHNIKFHRLIADRIYPKDDKYNEVDHINRLPYDNRRNNLRRCNRSQNTKNRIGHSNTKLKYITYDKSRDRYIITIDNIYIGQSKNMYDAKLIRDNYLNNHPDSFRCTLNKNIITPFKIIDINKFYNK